MVTLPKMKDPRFASLWKNVRALDKKLDIDPLASGEFTFRDSDKLWLFLEEVRKAIAGIFEALEINFVVSGAPIGVAVATVVCSSDNLSTTATANDTLTIPSQTECEFDFTDGRRFTTVVLSPGRGVQPLSLRLDKIISTGDVDWPQSVYAKDSTKLQLMRWNTGTSEWDAMPFDPGWTVTATQIFASSLSVLPTGED